MLVYALGIACVAWTLFELAALLRAPATVAAPASAPVHVASKPAEARTRTARPRRVPLAAWDESGRPICVEDVSLRGAN